MNTRSTIRNPSRPPAEAIAGSLCRPEICNAWQTSEGEMPLMSRLFVHNFAAELGIAWAFWRIRARIVSTSARLAALSVFIVLLCSAT